MQIELGETSEISRAALLGKFKNELSILKQDPTVIYYRWVLDLVNQLEPTNGQLKLNFSGPPDPPDKKPRKTKNGKISYPGMKPAVLKILKALDETEPGAWWSLKTITEDAAEHFGVKGKKTLAHLHGCVSACVNKPMPEIIWNTDSFGRRIFKLSTAVTNEKK